MDREGKRLLLKVSVLLAAITAFGILFSSPLGIMGWAFRFIDATLKTKIILALSMFGLGMLVALTWWMVSDKQKNEDEDHSGRYWAVIFIFGYAVTWSWQYQDCNIFNFCDRAESTANCHQDFDKTGAFLDCDYPSSKKDDQVLSLESTKSPGVKELSDEEVFSEARGRVLSPK